MTSDGQIGQAGITTAVAWRFIEDMVPDLRRAMDHPTLAKLSERPEVLPAFVAYPHDGPGVVASGLT